jgi:glycine/D-amino acid oxidase-like deaminating enzyme
LPVLLVRSPGRNLSGTQQIDDALRVDRRLHRADQVRVERFLTNQLPGVRRDGADLSVSIYTLPPDEHFVVDRHPADARIVLAAGLFGHGLKFTCVLGEAPADLALAGRIDLTI